MKPLLLRRLLAAILLLGLLLAACGPASTRPVSNGKLNVVATYSVLGDLVSRVGRDRINLTVLVGPEQDTHTYEPSPSNGVALAEAALIFENGLGFETWLDDLYQSSGSQAERLVATSTIEPIRLDEAGSDPEQGEFDPHVWHSVANAMAMVGQVTEGLARADPDNAELYRANAAGYTAQLKELDAWVINQVQQIPEARRKLVTTHDTFSYFAQRYGFEVVGTVLPASTEGASPSAQELAALIEAVKAQEVPAVFAENVSSNALINQVANEAGVHLVASLYTDALGPPGSEGDTYLKMIRYNVATISTALTS